jgi:hypothetical protein
MFLIEKVEKNFAEMPVPRVFAKNIVPSSINDPTPQQEFPIHLAQPIPGPVGIHEPTIIEHSRAESAAVHDLDYLAIPAAYHPPPMNDKGQPGLFGPDLDPVPP